MGMEKDEFGNRMKLYEGFEAARVLMPMLPVVARMDGIAFHSFTQGLKRPYDERLSMLMVEVSAWLLQHFGADAAYTQSDEITLGWHLESYEDELFCGGRIQKLNSHLAAKTSVRFNALLPKFIPEKVGLDPVFDARVFSVPNLAEAANQFLWREQDASKNSISMAARAYFSHNQIMNKNGSEMQEMLWSQKNVNWNDYPNFFKRGTFILKRRVSTPFTVEELAALPEKHAARRNPGLVVERNRYIRFSDLPKFSTIVNREAFLFLGEDPKTALQLAS
jgi:tRNA(His) 5'-end guanylyltransferase